MPKTSTTPAPAAGSPTRARLLAKRRPRVTHPVLVEDPEPHGQAVAEARAALRQAAAVGQDTSAAEAAVQEAQARLGACWEPVVLYALPGNRLPELVAAHPPTDEQKKAGAEWNPETFHAALIAACAEDSGMSEQDWANELTSDRWSQADRNALFGAALDVNLSSSSDRLRRSLSSSY